MKKVLALLLVIACLFCTVPFGMAADEDEAPVESVEIVLLLDVSASMNMADPQMTVNDVAKRVSTEAALNFVYNYPTEKSMYIKVIPYNSQVYTGFESVNVSTEKGLAKYEQNMQMVLDDLRANETIDGISCWRFTTDIGAALEAATQTLTASTADKKAVILFTDGRIELITDSDEVTSHRKAAESKTALNEMGVPIFCIGLNKDSSVDVEFLKGLSDSDATPGETAVVTKASELGDVFRRIHTYLFEDAHMGESEPPIPLPPDVPVEKAFRMYGDAVREANITIASDAALHSFTVTTPKGTVVADVDLVAGKENVNETYCLIKVTPSTCTATIKLLNPMDGDWKIVFTGDESTVLVSKLYLFDLKVHHDVAAGQKVYVEDGMQFDATIFNKETNTHVTSSGLYEGETGSLAVVDVVNTQSGRGTLYNGTLNAAKNGYDFTVSFDKPGTYDLKMMITHSQFELEDVATVEVVGPAITLAAADGEVVLQLVNPITGESVSNVPAFMNGMEGTLKILSGETVVAEQTFAVTDMQNGSCVFPFDPETAGVYTAEATLSGYDTTISSGAVSITVNASEISMKEELTSRIEKSGMSAEYEETFDLNEYFEDSDGDELIYEIVAADDDLLDVEIDKKDRLTISVKDFGESTVSIRVTDGKGAEYTCNIDVVIKSTVGLVVALAIVAAVLIVAVVIFLIIVNKRKVIRFGFRVKLERNEEEQYTSAVFNVNRLASNKHAKPTMALSTLLSSHNTFSQLLATEFEEGELDALAAQCDCITVTGQPFKRAFNIALKGKKKGTFTKSQVRVSIPGSNLTVIFGSVNDFNSSDDFYGY